MSQQWAQAETERILANLIRIGVVTELDDTKARVKVRTGGIVTDWLPWLTHRASEDRSWWAPEPGEQVVVLSPYGDQSQAVVMPAIYQTAYPATADKRTIRRTIYQDGTVVEYDREAHVMNITLNPAGTFNVTVGGSLITMNTGRILLSSNGSTLELDAAGIRLNGARIDLN
jgi:phage baseplate assembly protein V